LALLSSCSRSLNADGPNSTLFARNIKGLYASFTAIPAKREPGKPGVALSLREAAAASLADGEAKTRMRGVAPSNRERE
jgi:hypothetical protein